MPLRPLIKPKISIFALLNTEVALVTLKTADAIHSGIKLIKTKCNDGDTVIDINELTMITANVLCKVAFDLKYGTIHRTQTPVAAASIPLKEIMYPLIIGSVLKRYTSTLVKLSRKTIMEKLIKNLIVKASQTACHGIRLISLNALKQDNKSNSPAFAFLLTDCGITQYIKEKFNKNIKDDSVATFVNPFSVTVK